MCGIGGRGQLLMVLASKRHFLSSFDLWCLRGLVGRAIQCSMHDTHAVHACATGWMMIVHNHAEKINGAALIGVQGFFPVYPNMSDLASHLLKFNG